MAGGAGSFRDDHANLILSEEVADHLAQRMAVRFHTLAQNLKGGALGGNPGPGQVNPVTQNQWGGKGIVKFNPSENEIVQGIKQQISLFTWQSPDGLPHYVTVEVGRLAGGLGGPGSDGSPGGLVVVNPTNATGQGSIGGGTWPAAANAAGNPFYYRATAQVLIGTPGTMQDPFFVDINRGQRFTALASYVAVTAQMNGPPIDEQTGAVLIPTNFGSSNFTTPYVSGSLAVYATLGMAVAPSLSPVLYTQYIDNALEAGANFQYVRIIPPRANFLLPVVSSNAGDKIVLVFFDNAGTAIVETAAGAATSVTPMASPTESLISPIAIPADAYGVLLNSQAGAALNYRLMYQLSV